MQKAFYNEKLTFLFLFFSRGYDQSYAALMRIYSSYAGGHYVEITQGNSDIHAALMVEKIK